MWEQGYITQEEYDDAWEEKLNFQATEEIESVLEPTSFFDDHVINSVIADLMVKKDITKQEAANELYMSGYKIYTTQDIKRQEALEELFLTVDNFPPIARDEYPEGAAIVTDHNGAIIALVGQIGPKTESRSFNRATMAKRQPGSTFKLIGPYALAFEYNIITPSTIIQDSPINPDAPESEWYPRNFYRDYLGNVTVEHAIRRSINTVAVKVGQLVSPASLFDFFYYDLNITSLVDPVDIDIAPMALGSVTYGVTPLELVGAYQMIANGGKFTAPYAYTKVVDTKGNIVVQPDMTARQVISEDTAVLLNKMAQVVVNSGTGTAAKVNNMPTGGKTGTSDEDVDQWFVGFTPYYVCNVWLGYDEPETVDKYGNWVKNSVLYLPYPYPTPYLFKSVMDLMHEGLEPAEFVTSPDVIQQTYCTITGNLASTGCLTTASTWYKASNLPPVCSGKHDYPDPEEEDAENGDSSSSSDSGSSSSSNED